MEIAIKQIRKRVAELFGQICSGDPDVKWPAVAGMGAAAAQLAERDMESARTIMRRLMWSLNDESGGIGWGAAESMAEAMVHNEALADEFQHILVSFLSEYGYDVDFAPLRRGAVWAVARLAAARPGLPRDAEKVLTPLLDCDDAETRKLAAEALAHLKAAACGDAALQTNKHRLNTNSQGSSMKQKGAQAL